MGLISQFRACNQNKFFKNEPCTASKVKKFPTHCIFAKPRIYLFVVSIMHDLEPHFAWLNQYSAADDQRSPFYQREYSEFYFDKTVYNYLIHPQWDQFGSNTLYIKILFADYQDKFAIIEMIGEWNDALYNDIMTLKREVLELMMAEGINKFQNFSL